MKPEVFVFFYGSFINFDVLKDIGFVPRLWEVARLDGFDIRIEPLANLVRSDQHCVYGILAAATHDELNALYAHAQSTLHEDYLPEAVLVTTLAGHYRPALCYICPQMHAKPGNSAYIDRIVGPAKDHGFPDWYIDRLNRFRP